MAIAQEEQSEFYDDWEDSSRSEGSLYAEMGSSLNTCLTHNTSGRLIPLEDAIMFGFATLRRGRETLVVEEKIADIDEERYDMASFRTIKRVGEALLAVAVRMSDGTKMGRAQLDLHLAPISSDQRYHREIPISLDLLAEYIQLHPEFHDAAITMTTHATLGNIIGGHGFSVSSVTVSREEQETILDSYKAGVRRGIQVPDTINVVRCYASAKDILKRLPSKP